MTITDNRSDTGAGVHMGLLNVNFMAQMLEFSILAHSFTNDGLLETAAAANAKLETQIQVMEATSLVAANPGALAKLKKRSAPPLRNNNLKLIKVPAPSPIKSF